MNQPKNQLDNYSTIITANNNNKNSKPSSTKQTLALYYNKPKKMKKKKLYKLNTHFNIPFNQTLKNKINCQKKQNKKHTIQKTPIDHTDVSISATHR